MSYVEDLSRLLEARRPATEEISDQIWGFAESRFTEFHSSAAQADYMKSLGFKVTMGIGGEETAFVAEYGEGKPVIALLGEYDALSGLSQEADIAEHCPIVQGGDGHGCGHNMLGAGSLAAAFAIKDYLSSTGREGTVIFYGCPGEEGGCCRAQGLYGREKAARHDPLLRMPCRGERRRQGIPCPRRLLQ